MTRAQVLPQGLRTTRVIVFLQGGLGVLRGALLIFGGAAYSSALGLKGGGGVAVFIAVGALVVLVSALVVWAGRLLGQLSRGARRGVLVFEYLSIVFGILSFADPWQAGVTVVLAVIAVYYLQFQAETRELFVAPRAAP